MPFLTFLWTRKKQPEIHGCSMFQYGKTEILYTYRKQLCFWDWGRVSRCGRDGASGVLSQCLLLPYLGQFPRKLHSRHASSPVPAPRRHHVGPMRPRAHALTALTAPRCCEDRAANELVPRYGAQRDWRRGRGRLRGLVWDGR